MVIFRGLQGRHQTITLPALRQHRQGMASVLIGNLHLFLEDILPHSLGKPLFASVAGATSRALKLAASGGVVLPRLLVFPVMLVAAVHFHFVDQLLVFRSVFYQGLILLPAVSSGSLRTNATTSQSRSSSWVTPQAGMPVIWMPCLTTQNCSAGVRVVLRRSSGARGYRPADFRSLHARGKMTATAHHRILARTF